MSFPFCIGALNSAELLSARGDKSLASLAGDERRRNDGNASALLALLTPPARPPVSKMLLEVAGGAKRRQGGEVERRGGALHHFNLPYVSCTWRSWPRFLCSFTSGTPGERMCGCICIRHVYQSPDVCFLSFGPFGYLCYSCWTVYTVTQNVVKRLIAFTLWSTDTKEEFNLGWN